MSISLMGPFTGISVGISLGYIATTSLMDTLTFTGMHAVFPLRLNRLTQLFVRKFYHRLINLLIPLENSYGF